ncbi:GAF domain-containing protein [Candidatus Omnitrophota bacterium]
MSITIAKQDFAKRLAQVMLRMDSLDQFLNALVEMMVEVFKVNWTTLSLLDDSGQYKLKAAARIPAESEQSEHSAVRGKSWSDQRQKILSQRLLEEFGTQMEPKLREELNQVNTAASMPLFAGDELIAVLNLGPKTAGQDLTKEELELLADFAQLIGSGIQQAITYSQLSRQRKHHQNIIDNLISGIVAIDAEDKITIFNRAAARILKVNADDVLGQEVRILQPNLANLLLETLHKGNSFRRQELYVQPENTLIGVSTSQFYDAKGTLLGACLVFSNLAEVKRQESTQRQQNLDSYWSNVANSLAHEVKNSIMAAKVYTEMFPKRYEDAEFRWTLYSTLKRDMDKLDNFSERVLDFAQSQDLVLQPCAVPEIMDAAVASVFEEKAKQAAGVSLEKHYAPDLKPVSGDYHQLKQALAQVITNALEAMGDQGTLTLSIEQETDPQMLTYNLPQAVRHLPSGELLVIKIADTGDS